MHRYYVFNIKIKSKTALSKKNKMRSMM